MAIDRIPNDFCRGHWCNYAGIGPFDHCGHAGSFDARDVKYFDPRTGDRPYREQPYDARVVLWGDGDGAVFIQEIWRTQLSNLDHLPLPTIQYPKVLILESIIFLLVLVFFVVGKMLPVSVLPVTIALLSAVLCLLVTHCSRIDSVSNILCDVDWSTILFFMSIFVVIGALQKTGVISSASGFLAIILGKILLWEVLCCYLRSG